MFEYIANICARAEEAGRAIDRLRPDTPEAVAMFEREEAAYRRMAHVQWASHRLFERAVAAWSWAGRPTRGETVSRIVRATARLATAYGNGKIVDGHEAIHATWWINHVEVSPWNLENICGPWAADVEALALFAADDTLEGSYGLEQLLYMA